MRTRRLVNAMGLAGALFLAGSVSMSAHHAFSAEFDANKPIKLKGTVAKVEWINPHSWIHIDVKGPDGKVQRWMVEGGNPTVLLRRGLNKTRSRREPRLSLTAIAPRGIRRARTVATSPFLTAGSSSWAPPGPALRSMDAIRRRRSTWRHARWPRFLRRPSWPSGMRRFPRRRGAADGVPRAAPAGH